MVDPWGREPDCLRWARDVAMNRIQLHVKRSATIALPAPSNDWPPFFHVTMNMQHPDVLPPPSCPPGSQECVRFHTISRATGRARIWEVGLTFSGLSVANEFDAEGLPALSPSLPLSAPPLVLFCRQCFRHISPVTSCPFGLVSHFAFQMDGSWSTWASRIAPRV